jgi:hypothetical protein
MMSDLQANQEAEGNEKWAKSSVFWHGAEV